MSLVKTTAFTGESLQRMLVAACLAVLACSPTPRWIAVADGAAESLLLFDPDLSSAVTVRFDYPTVALGESHQLQFSNGGGAALVEFTVPGQDDALLRVRLVDGAIVDQWPTARHETPNHWTYLEDSRVVVGVGTDSMGGGRAGYVSLGIPDQDWAIRTLPACHSEPTGLARFNRGERIYVSCDGQPGSIVEIDPVRSRVVRTSSAGLGGCSPERIKFSRNEGILFVLCSDTGWLLSLDRVSLLPIDSVEIGSGVRDLLVLPRAPEALLLAPNRNELIILNLRDHSVRTRLTTAGSPGQGTVTHGGRAAYITTASAGVGGGYLVKIDLTRGRIIASVPIPAGAIAVAAWPGRRSPRMDWR